MTQNQWAKLLPEGWLERVKQRLEKKMRFAAELAQQHDYIPYTTENGDWKKETIDWWTNGFWGAEMWQMALMTGDAFFRQAAVRAETMMDAALRDFKVLHHDVGFMWLIQSGVRFALEGNQDSYDRTALCANLLAARFNPNGFIRAWNGKGEEGLAIIDCMMNLPLLYWASRQTGDPRFALMAMRHADTAMQCFVRSDGSCNHQVYFDPCTGEYLRSPGGQGYESGSSWSRGQAWALYGFALSYMMTGKQAYLDTAMRVAGYVISCIGKTSYIARCDFRAPEEPVVLDNAASAIIASGLLVLADLAPTQQQAYAQAACSILLALERDYGDFTNDQPAILTECAAMYHGTQHHHMTMNYADYYFIEAVHRLMGNKMLFWAPDLQGENAILKG